MHFAGCPSAVMLLMFLMTGLGLWVLGRKIIKAKCHFHHLSRAYTIYMMLTLITWLKWCLSDFFTSTLFTSYPPFHTVLFEKKSLSPNHVVVSSFPLLGLKICIFPLIFLHRDLALPYLWTHSTIYLFFNAFIFGFHWFFIAACKLSLVAVSEVSAGVAFLSGVCALEHMGLQSGTRP